jgi:hypothetical protein
VKARNHGFFIQQIGLDYFPRVLGTSHLSSPAVIMKIFRELIAMFPEMRRRVPRGGQAILPVASEDRRDRLSSTQ